MASTSGKSLLIEGEKHYVAGRVTEAFEFYRKAIVRILDHEDILQKALNAPEEYAQEIIICAWQNLLACFRQSNSGFTQESSPDAYALVFSFRPTAPSRTHPQFKGQPGRRLLKAMQIMASFALAVLAWEQGERSTAARRYQEALDVAATHPRFNSVTPGLKHLDRIIAFEVQSIKDNLATLKEGDLFTTTVTGAAPGTLRKEVLNAPHVRLGDDGEIAQQNTFVVATDACGRVGCSERGVKFKRCSACHKVAYCSVECQREDWQYAVSNISVQLLTTFPGPTRRRTVRDANHYE
ncbi:hypothetical protein C8R43DRAFT_890488 [Mycena crocata]|nr:hypothetical protein C8R43DRAFT_890488 [Mycena crocata]